MARGGFLFELHQDLIDRKVALPQYAGTKQKILEVFARWITRDTYSLKGRGSIDTFDADGFMERDRAEELVGWVVKRAQQKLTGGNVVNIEPTLSERRYKREHLWKPTVSMLRLIEADFRRGPERRRGSGSRGPNSWLRRAASAGCGLIAYHAPIYLDENR